MNFFPKMLFVTGTGTEVGKTLISALLALGLRGGYWKPVQTGLSYDREWVAIHTKLPKSHFFKECHAFKTPLSPHLAAAIEKRRIDLADFILPSFSPLPHLIIEGCGGVLVPLNEREYMIDLMAKWNIPVLVVAKNCLGTINHTLLTLHALKSRSLSIFGVVLNGKKTISHKETIERLGQVRVVEMDYLSSITPSLLEELFQRKFG